MKSNATLLFYLLLLPVIIFSQDVTQHCGFDELASQLQNEDATYFDRQDEIELNYLNFVSTSNTLALYDSISLPVVIHIVHLPGTPIGENENITDDQVRLGLDRLNNTFAGKACSENPVGNDMNIKFELAQRNIHGEETNGIIRHSSTLSEFGFGGYTFMILDAVGFSSPFPTRDYINIYLVKSICYAIINDECSGPLGLATSPSSHGLIADGIAIESGIWINDDECYSGKLAAHEMGHYLNLLHTFENGCPNENCLTQGDRVCDTAPDNSSDRNNQACQTGVFNNSCSTDLDDQYCNIFVTDAPDPEDNIMDYSSFACQYLFTDGQKARMHSSLRTTRNSLVQSNAFTDPCTSIVSTWIQGDLDALVDSTSTYLSNIENVDSVAWLVDSVLVSHETNLAFTFTEVGEHTLTLRAFNDSGCSKEEFRIIKVYRSDCNLTAQLGEIPTLCSTFGDAYIKLNSIPSGGEWKDENGKILSNSVRNEFYTSGFQPGTHPIFYTIKEGWCQQTFETEFTVSDHRLDVMFTGEIDCNSDEPESILMSIYSDEPGYWQDNQFNGDDFNGITETPITKAGTYQFTMLDEFSECSLNFDAPSSIPASVQIEPCNDCQSNINLCINSNLEDIHVNWYGGYPWNPGNWEAVVIDKNTGCQSWTNLQTTSLENLNPSCSAGSTSGISCGKTTKLLGAINSLSGDLDYWWSTTDGNIIAGARTLTPTIDRPGTYALYARNRITGCEDIDMTTVNPLTKNTVINESICFGDSYEEYTTSGTYVDTIKYACDCDSIRTLNLEVYQTEISSEITNAIGSENNGSITLTEIEGDAPFNFAWSTGATTQNIENLTSEDYSVIITDANGCETTFDFFVDIASSINDLNENIHITLSPNPVIENDIASINIESKQFGKYLIEVYDLLGRKIENIIHPHYSENSSAQFSPTRSGIYLVTIESDLFKKKTFKLVVK